MTSTETPVDFSTLKEPTRVSGGEGELGHMDELRTDPISLFWRVREECGELGIFRIADRDICLASGAAANEAFFRAPDESLDQAAAYPFMTPVSGRASCSTPARSGGRRCCTTPPCAGSTCVSTRSPSRARSSG